MYVSWLPLILSFPVVQINQRRTISDFLARLVQFSGIAATLPVIYNSFVLSSNSLHLFFTAREMLCNYLGYLAWCPYRVSFCRLPALLVIDLIVLVDELEPCPSEVTLIIFGFAPSQYIPYHNDDYALYLLCIVPISGDQMWQCPP